MEVIIIRSEVLYKVETSDLDMFFIFPEDPAVLCKQRNVCSKVLRYDIDFILVISGK